MESEALTVADGLALGYAAFFSFGLVGIYWVLETIVALLDIRKYENELKNLEEQRRAPKNADRAFKIRQEIYVVKNFRIKEAKQTLVDSIAMSIIGGIVGFFLYSVVQVAQH